LTSYATVVGCPQMQRLILLAAAIAASVALVAVPADAASKKGKNQPAKPAPEASHRGQPNAVYDGGRIIGVDPDPFIQLMIKRDPRPWDGPT
jgi:hypothetical protein